MERSPIENSPNGMANDMFDASSQERYIDIDLWTRVDEKFGKIIKNLTGEEKWVDLGSGLQTGIVRALVDAKKVNSDNLISIDLDIRNLNRQQKDGRVGVKVNADAAQIPLADASVDFVVTHMMMADNRPNLTYKKEKIQSEVARIVKDEGFLIITDSLSDDDKVVSENFEFCFESGLFH